MSTDHKAVFVETDRSNESKKQANKQKPSAQWWEKSEDLKMDWKIWQDTVEQIARTGGVIVDFSSRQQLRSSSASVLPFPQRHVLPLALPR